MNFNQYVQCNTGEMIITGLSERTNGEKLSKDYTGWDFRVWVLAVVTGWPGRINRGFMTKCMAFRRDKKVY